MDINNMTDEEYHVYMEEQRRPKEPIRSNYSESREQWHNNVSPHVEMYYWPEQKRRRCADKLGPNWASVMSGIGDQ